MTQTLIKLRHPPKAVLLIATRLIGDVLLNTPLLRSMRMAWPEARIDVLVFKGAGSILQGNPDCTSVIELATKPSFLETISLIRRLFRRYELAVTTQGGDRPHWLMLFAASQRVGLVGETGWKSAWKQTLSDCILLDNLHTHTVVQNLALADRLGLKLSYEVVPPCDPEGENELARLLSFDWRKTPFVVLHPYPSLKYKQWTTAGWIGLIEHFIQLGMRVVLSGGPDPEEVYNCAELAKSRPALITDLSGKTHFSSLATLLRLAECYVGPDTSTTHLAAACGTPTLALFGPSNPVKWGPWPKDCEISPSPWVMKSEGWQTCKNVVLLQGIGECVPCFHEGCGRKRESISECLTGLTLQRVKGALTAAINQ